MNEYTKREYELEPENQEEWEEFLQNCYNYRDDLCQVFKNAFNEGGPLYDADAEGDYGLDEPIKESLWHNTYSNFMYYIKGILNQREIEYSDVGEDYAFEFSVEKGVTVESLSYYITAESSYIDIGGMRLKAKGDVDIRELIEWSEFVKVRASVSEPEPEVSGTGIFGSLGSSFHHSIIEEFIDNSIDSRRKKVLKAIIGLIGKNGLIQLIDLLDKESERKATTHVVSTFYYSDILDIIADELELEWVEGEESHYIYFCEPDVADEIEDLASDIRQNNHYERGMLLGYPEPAVERFGHETVYRLPEMLFWMLKDGTIDWDDLYYYDIENYKEVAYRERILNRIERGRDLAEKVREFEERYELSILPEQEYEDIDLPETWEELAQFEGIDKQ